MYCSGNIYWETDCFLLLFYILNDLNVLNRKAMTIRVVKDKSLKTKYSSVNYHKLGNKIQWSWHFSRQGCLCREYLNLMHCKSTHWWQWEMAQARVDLQTDWVTKAIQVQVTSQGFKLLKFNCIVTKWKWMLRNMTTLWCYCKVNSTDLENHKFKPWSWILNNH
jgi:hypothetical protein